MIAALEGYIGLVEGCGRLARTPLGYPRVSGYSAYMYNHVCFTLLLLINPRIDAVQKRV